MRRSGRTRRDRRLARRLGSTWPLGLVLLAACGGGGDGNNDERGDGANPPLVGVPALEVVGDNLRFEPDALTVDGERFNVAFTADDVFHTFVIEGADGDDVVAAARPGETDRGGIELEPGEYVFYCDVPGHRAGGMEGTLTVE
ncbi:MAG: plastocyanin/azurin family copper-binding protein [Acidimicrobiia bacterium]